MKLIHSLSTFFFLLFFLPLIPFFLQATFFRFFS